MDKLITGALDRYVNDRVETGGFLRAVLENNLFEAIGRADSQNQHRLREICQYIYNEIPANCWGSKKIVNDWLNKKEDE